MSPQHFLSRAYSPAQAPKAVEFRYWYSRVWRSWGVAKFDAEGNQMGSADWFYSADEAYNSVREEADECGLRIVKDKIA